MVALATSRTTGNGFAPKNTFTITTKPNHEDHTHFELLKIALGTELHITSWYTFWSPNRHLIWKRQKTKKHDLLNKKKQTPLIYCLTAQCSSFKFCLHSKYMQHWIQCILTCCMKLPMRMQLYAPKSQNMRAKMPLYECLSYSSIMI